MVISFSYPMGNTGVKIPAIAGTQATGIEPIDKTLSKEDRDKIAEAIKNSKSDVTEVQVSNGTTVKIVDPSKNPSVLEHNEERAKIIKRLDEEKNFPNEVMTTIKFVVVGAAIIAVVAVTGSTIKMFR